MIYHISATESTHNFLLYDHGRSIDYNLFLLGAKLQAPGPLIYRIREELHLLQIHKYHIVESTGPTLFSVVLKDIIEAIAPNEAEFFLANLFYENHKIEDYYAINPLYRLDCVDMSKSNYEQSNFDQHNPKYNFYHEVLLDKIPHGAKIAICNEFPVQIIVDQVIKRECISRDLKRLRFCRSIDTAQGDRSECETT